MEHDHLSRAADSPSTEEAIALLRYLAGHNAHHAEELLEAAGALPDEAAKLIGEAAELLQQSSERIERALAQTEV